MTLSRRIFLVVFFSFQYFFFDVYLKERETECQRGRVRERGRHGTQSRLQAPSRQHRARRGARTQWMWDHDLSRSRTLNQLSPGVKDDHSLPSIVHTHTCICLCSTHLTRLPLLDRGLAKHSLWLTSGPPPPLFINKVLLEHAHACSLTYRPWLSSHNSRLG